MINFTTSPCWLFLNGSKTVNDATLAFRSIQHFNRDIAAKFGVPNLPQSPDIGKNSEVGMSDFPISGQSLITESCHNFRTIDDIHMKLWSVTKFDRRNNTTSKKIDYDVISASYDIFVIFFFMVNLEQSWSWIPEAWSIKLTFSIKVTFYLTKTETRTKKYLKNLYPKNVDFFPKKNANISKTKRALVLNSIVSENNCVCTYVPNWSFWHNSNKF